MALNFTGVGMLLSADYANKSRLAAAIFSKDTELFSRTDRECYVVQNSMMTRPSLVSFHDVIQQDHWLALGEHFHPAIGHKGEGDKRHSKTYKKNV